MKKIIIVCLFLLTSSSSFAQYYKSYLLAGRKWKGSLHATMGFDFQLKKKYNKLSKVEQKKLENQYKKMALYLGDNSKLTLWRNNQPTYGTYTLKNRHLILRWKYKGKMRSYDFVVLEIDFDGDNAYELVLMNVRSGKKFGYWYFK